MLLDTLSVSCAGSPLVSLVSLVSTSYPPTPPLPHITSGSCLPSGDPLMAQDPTAKSGTAWSMSARQMNWYSYLEWYMI